MSRTHLQTSSLPHRPRALLSLRPPSRRRPPPLPSAPSRSGPQRWKGRATGPSHRVRRGRGLLRRRSRAREARALAGRCRCAGGRTVPRMRWCGGRLRSSHRSCPSPPTPWCGPYEASTLCAFWSLPCCRLLLLRTRSNRCCAERLLDELLLEIFPGILPFLQACWQRLVLVLLFTLHELGRRFGKVGETLAAEVLEHLPYNRSGKIEVKGQSLRVGEGLVLVTLVAQSIERLGGVLGRHEGVAAGRHAQVLEERKIQAPHHADDRLGLVDAPPHEEARVIAIGPASQDLALVHIVVLGQPVLELTEQPARKDAEVFVPEEPAVSFDAHDGARAGDGQRLFLVLECIVELADHAANLILTASALHECTRVDHQRGLRAFPGYLVELARRPLEPPVVVLQVLYLPGCLADLIR